MDIELNRNFSASGSDIKDFLDAVHSMEDATSELVVSSINLGMSAIVDTVADASEIAITTSSNIPLDAYTERIWSDVQRANENDKITLYRYRPGQNFKIDTTRKDVMCNLEGMTEELFNEVCHQSKTMISIYPTDISENAKTYFVSDLAFSTLNNRARIGGDAMSKPSIGRVVECAKAFYLHRPQKIKFIIRTKGKTRVIIAAHSDKYCYVPQTILCDIYRRIAENLGETHCLHWEVNHEISHCYVGFPQIASDFAAVYDLPAKVVPGLYFSTSDSGDGSLTIRSIWNINGRNIGGEAIKRNHRGEIDVERFVDDAWKTIFSKYNAVPERLTELLAIDVPDPAWTIRSIFKQIELARASNLGRHATKDLYEALVAELDKKANYTAYDIAMSLLSIPERCAGGLHHSVIEKMESLMYKAIFADYEKKKSKKEELSFTLV